MEQNKILDIQRRVHENKEWGLVISRIPPQTKRTFIELADQEFCSDYGMTLREILNQYMEYQEIKGFFFNLTQLQMVISDMQTRMMAIEAREGADKKKTVTTLNGKVKKVKE